VDHERLADDLLDGHARIKAGVGILEDHLHLAPHLPHLFALQMDQVFVFEMDFSGRGFV